MTRQLLGVARSPGAPTSSTTEDRRSAIARCGLADINRDTTGVQDSRSGEMSLPKRSRVDKPEFFLIKLPHSVLEVRAHVPTKCSHPI